MFVSYAEQDRDSAELLASGLRAEGVRVFFDRCSLQPGDVVVHELEAALRSSRHGVLVIGAQAVAEPWARQEYAALVQAAARSRLRLIPVLFGDADLPAFAATRLWMDFRKVHGPAFDARVAELARALRGGQPAPGDYRAAIREALDALRAPPRDPAPSLRTQTHPAFVVCYARADAAYGARLLRQLSEAKLPTWSLGDLTWGDDYLAVTRQQIREALAVIVLMSPEAEESDDVTREILEGQRHSRFFLPVLLRGEPAYLLASTRYFDGRDGRLPGPGELDLLVQIAADRGPSCAIELPDGLDGLTTVGGRRPRTPAATSLLPLLPRSLRAPAPDTHAASRTRPPSLDRLEELLSEQETEHADLLTTTLLLESVGRLADGWLRRADGHRLPDSLLADVDGLWSRFTDGRHGFGAQTRRAVLGGGRRADFQSLALEYGWRSCVEAAVPRYQHFTAGADRPGFFPSLRNPQTEQYRDWYDQWAETVLSVHLQLRERGWPR